MSRVGGLADALVSDALVEKNILPLRGRMTWETMDVSSASQIESARLEALDRLNILDTVPEQNFDDLTTIAATICGVPISLVSFVAADRQWFKAKKGTDVSETSREMSFCAHTLEDKQTLVVPNALEDPRFNKNALVTEAPGIRFYAGAPIVTREGHALGTVCVIDTAPHLLSGEQVAALEALARQASSLLEHRSSSAANARLAQDARSAFAQARDDREQLLVAMDAAELAAWFYDPAMNIVGGDARMAKFFGLDVPEGPAEVWLQAIVEEDRERVGKEFAASLDGAPYDTKYRVLVDGELRWLHARAKVRVNADGTVRMTGICEDITREESLAIILEKTLERLTLAQNVSGAATFDWDLKSDTVLWSAATFGRSPAEMLKPSAAFDLIHPDDRALLQRVIARSRETGERYKFECRAYWPDGSLHWISTAGNPLRNEAGEVASIVGVNVDITDRKLQEEALLRTEKLAAVGRLASTISHEINNPLEAVTNLLYIVRLSATLTEQDREHLELADRELARVSHIVAQTLRFHRNPASPTLVDARRLVEEVLELYDSRLAASSIQLKREMDADVRFKAYEGDIRQVVNNLVANAFDVMRQGGTLRIRARCATDWASMREGAAITIADTGTGIPAEMQRRLFEAFFSTKGIHGSGLGLWISQSIVQKHEGHLRFRSSSTERAHGTVFRLWLPLKAASGAGEAWAVISGEAS